MGISCYMIVEVKSERGWELIDSSNNTVIPPGTFSKAGEYNPLENVIYFDHMNDTRNFNKLMGFLQEPERLTDLKGLPEDLGQSAREFFEYCKGESASWLTPDEIRSMRWDQEVVVDCMVEREHAKFFSDPPGRFPSEDITLTRNGVTYPAGPSRYVKDGVHVQYLLSLRHYYRGFLLKVEQAVEVQAPQPIRFVYWFG